MRESSGLLPHPVQKEDHWADWRRNPVGNAFALAALAVYAALVVAICVSAVG